MDFCPISRGFGRYLFFDGGMSNLKINKKWFIL